MSTPANTVPAPNRPDVGTLLAYERTYLAHESNQMAWIRTALSLISFGFSIAKFFEYLGGKGGQPAPFLGPRAVGVLMIAIGLLAMTLAARQNRRALAILRRGWPGATDSSSRVSASYRNR